MKRSYLTLLVGIIVVLWIIYFIQYYFTVYKNVYKNNYDKHNIEGFTPKIKQLYRPYIRAFNNTYDHFMNNYGSTYVFNKLRKWNIY